MSLPVLLTVALLGAGVIAFSVRWRRAIAIPAVVIGTTSILYSLIEVFDPDRLRGALAPTLLFIAATTLPIVVILGVWAFQLWKKHAKHPPDELRANLAIALGAGAVVTFVILLVQTMIQVIDYEQNLANQRQSIRLAIGTESDLSGLAAPLDPEDGELLDMSGYWFRGKKMNAASLNGVRFRGANFVFTDLSGTLMQGVDLSVGEDGRRTDLRAASLYWADLTNATVGNASFVDADLRRADLCGVDLTQANLTRADLRGATLESDFASGGLCDTTGTLPPRDKYPDACWPDEIDAHDGCGAEARSVVCQREGRVPQHPQPDPAEARCEPQG